MQLWPFTNSLYGYKWADHSIRGVTYWIITGISGHNCVWHEWPCWNKYGMVCIFSFWYSGKLYIHHLNLQKMCLGHQTILLFILDLKTKSNNIILSQGCDAGVVNVCISPKHLQLVCWWSVGSWLPQRCLKRAHHSLFFQGLKYSYRNRNWNWTCSNSNKLKPQYILFCSVQLCFQTIFGFTNSRPRLYTSYHGLSWTSNPGCRACQRQHNASLHVALQQGLGGFGRP